MVAQSAPPSPIPRKSFREMYAGFKRTMLGPEADRTPGVSDKSTKQCFSLNPPLPPPLPTSKDANKNANKTKTRANRKQTKRGDDVWSGWNTRC